MKAVAVFTALSAFVGLAAAQAGIPTCVLTCSSQAAIAAGCISYTNVTCVCTSAQFQNLAGACLTANCTTTDQQAASALQSALCAGLSVTSGSVTNTVASATGSTSINSAALSSSVAASASSSASGVAASVSSVSASAASVSGSGASSAAGAASSAASAAASATSKAAGDKLEFGLKGFVGTGVALFGALMGAAVVL